MAIPIPPIRSNTNLANYSPNKANVAPIPRALSARLGAANQNDNGGECDDDEDDGNNVSLLTDLLWSDPSNLTDFFLPSNRGSGFYFGFIATNGFLQKNEMKLIVRGHESIKKGVELNHEKKVMTIYSSSSMSQGGLAGCVVFDDPYNFKVYKLSPIDVIVRSDAKFFTPALKQHHTIESMNVNAFKKRKGLHGNIHKYKSVPKNVKSSLQQTHNINCAAIENNNEQ